MAGIDVISSIVGIVGVGVKLSITLYEVADDIGSAGKDVRIIGSEMASFAQVNFQVLFWMYPISNRFHLDPSACEQEPRRRLKDEELHCH